MCVKYIEDRVIKKEENSVDRSHMGLRLYEG